jgi:hypothetical protein
METLHEFVERLSQSVGCHSHPCKSGYISLKKFKSNLHGNMGVFAWVRELRRKGIFEVATYKELADRAGVYKLADGEKPKMHWIHTGIFFFVKKDSKTDDFQKVVKALTAILKMK